jgi:hypothetical protein
MDGRCLSVMEADSSRFPTTPQRFNLDLDSHDVSLVGKPTPDLESFNASENSIRTTTHY